MKEAIGVLMAAVAFLSLSSCSQRAFIKGSYDEDITQPNLLTDKWSESDMQIAVRDLVKSLTAHHVIAGAKQPPVVIFTRIENNTDEHINTQSLMDMCRVELSRNGKVQFLDKAAREDIKKEYEYQNSGMVSYETRKSPGSQISADFIINGRLDSIVQEAGKNKRVYYKLTLNMTDLKTTKIEWSGYKQIRKKFRKRRIGL